MGKVWEISLDVAGQYGSFTPRRPNNCPGLDRAACPVAWQGDVTDFHVVLWCCGSFHRAAEAVHLSQSALSRSIQTLEEELGVILFDRTGKRSKITPVGTVLLENAHRLRLDYI
jgi:hypothetical protein